MLYKCKNYNLKLKIISREIILILILNLLFQINYIIKIYTLISKIQIINNKERVIEEINKNKLENIFNIISNLSDKVLDYNEKISNIIEMIKDAFKDQRVYNQE